MSPRPPTRLASASIPLFVGLAALTPALLVHGCGAAFESGSGGGAGGAEVVGPGAGGGGAGMVTQASSSSATPSASVGAGGEGGLGSATSTGVGGSGGGRPGACTSSTGCPALEYCDMTGHDPPACVPCSNWDHVAFGTPVRLSAGGSTVFVQYPRLSYDLLQPDLWFQTTPNVPSSMREIERAPVTSSQPPTWGPPEVVAISSGLNAISGMGTPALVDATMITLVSAGLRGRDTLFFDAADAGLDGGPTERHLWAGKVSFVGGHAVVSNAEKVANLANNELWGFTYSPDKKRAYATLGGSSPKLVNFDTDSATVSAPTLVIGVQYSQTCPAAGDLAAWVRPDGKGLFFQSDNPCGAVVQRTLFYQDLDGSGDGTGDAVPVLDATFDGRAMEPSLSPDQCALVFHDTNDDMGAFYAAQRQ